MSEETTEVVGLPVCPVSATRIKNRVDTVRENSWGHAVLCPMCLNYTVFDDVEELYSRQSRPVCSCGRELVKGTSKYEMVRLGAVFVWDECVV